MKSRLFFPALYALMMCLAANGQNAFDQNGAVTNGVFSVGENKQVKFSRGNLQYQASTNTWRFAENQYDYIGDDNENISATYNGWIDLFGWGTGNNPTNASGEFDDYSATIDWGTNKIANGGNTPDLWRTLSRDEWQYLFEGRPHASHLFGRATIRLSSFEIHGIIIMPDNWVASTLPLNEGMKGWSNNVYSFDEWNELQNAGAIFLPASGDRYGTNVDTVGDSGGYWSSTPYNNIRAYYLYFDAENFDPYYFSSRRTGLSVRLVQDL